MTYYLTLWVAHISIVLKEEYFPNCRLKAKLLILSVLCGHFIENTRKFLYIDD